ncbi:LOW QUALITY PROTEIN: uncharacterized protein WCC33_005074 [Rhinophrynus dorsalis]
MWIHFAPLKIPVSRRLQTAAVLQWTFSFLAMAQCCLALYLLLLFSQYWLLALLYGVWLYIDWDTPSRGGRRSDWVRNWTVWRYFAEYFPIKLVRTAELDPQYNYILGFHPHGVLVVGAFGNFCTEGTGFSRLFPGLTPHLLMLPAWFRVPFFREYIMSGSLVSSDKSSASHLLSQKAGVALVIAVGGPPEALDAKPGELTLQLLKRTGFIKLALTHGAHLVPVLSFGENDLYYQVSNPRGSLLRTTQEKMQKVMGIAIPLFHGRGVFQYSLGLLPHRRPVYTVVGSPIPVEKNPSPTPEEIASLHAVYIERLQKLFEDNKTRYGIPKDRHLVLRHSDTSRNHNMQESWRKHIQAVSAFQFVLTFLLMGTFFTILLLYLMFTSLWLIPVIYFIWLIFDWDTPETGGRRTEWVRRWTVWKHFRDYFPVKLVKSSQLSPDRNYILGCHPHGIISASNFCNFGTEAGGFSTLYPGVCPWLAVLAGLFRMPVYREYLMSAGLIPVSKDSLQFLLSRCGSGNAVFIVVGGAAESLQSVPGEYTVTLSGRKGFVRLALQNGADLVPVYSFGENELYEQIRLTPGSWAWKLQHLFQKYVGFAPCLFKGTGVFSDGWGINPFPRPLTTVVGRPIRVPYSPAPSEDEVSHYHALYIQGLKEIFDEYKISCGLSESDTLQIL